MPMFQGRWAVYPNIARFCRQRGELSVSVRLGDVSKTKPSASGPLISGEQGVHVVGDAIAEVVADDADAIQANDQWVAFAFR